MSAQTLADIMADERAERLARRTDPQTSKDAARRAVKFIAWTHADTIYNGLWKPMTAKEIAVWSLLTVVQIDRRMPELQREGKVRLTGEERDGFRVWERVIPQ